MQLHAGPILLQYEHGFLRTLTANGEEVLRMVYFAIRDRHWNTPRLTITNEQIRADANSFTINYDWQVDDRGIQVAGTNRIDGRADGSITFAFQGQALTTFFRNRMGLCVLHPVDGLAGQPCRIEHPDGAITPGVFPVVIEPYQPLLAIRTLHWQMASGQEFSVLFEGDVFETEDQRNWGDASYKTYSTPLERPIPVEALAGTVIQQSVTFRPVLLHPVNAPAQPSASKLHPGNPSSPRTGIGHRREGPPLSVVEASHLKILGLSHLRTDVYLHTPNWSDCLLMARQDADILEIPLEVALFFGAEPQAELDSLLTFVRTNSFPIWSVLLFEADTRRTTDDLLEKVLPTLRQQLPHVCIGGGTDAYFVDINRNRFAVDRLDFVTYSLNPQAHATDDQTMLENTAAQADMIQSAQSIFSGKPIHVSPVTLRPRFNSDGKDDITQTVPPADPRQSTAFCAEWTRLSLDALSRAGAASVTYFETHGPRGLLDGSDIFPVLSAIVHYQKSEHPPAPDSAVRASVRAGHP